MAHQPFTAKEVLRAAIDIEDAPLRQALEAGKGALVLAGHWSAWYHGPAALALAGVKAACVIYDMPVPAISDQFRKSARGFGWTPFTVGRRVPAAARRHFRENGALIIFADATIRPEESDWRPFGPAELSTDRGPARLAFLHGVPALYMRAEMLAGGRCRIRFIPLKAENPEGLSRAWLALLSGDVLWRPGHWWSASFAPVREPAHG
jgi:KDO2-lipid IV(A) lauroyltransferase